MTKQQQQQEQQEPDEQASQVADLVISRSAIEDYQFCRQFYYLRHKFQQTGIVLDYLGVPATTGGCVHKGIAYLLGRAGGLVNGETKLAKIAWEGATVDKAVQIAVSEYHYIVRQIEAENKGFSNKEIAQFTISEQTALTEALVRLWALRELPNIMLRFNVIAVEQEYSHKLTSGVMFCGTADAILEDKLSKELYVYSLKTTKGISRNMELSYRIDLQGVTETWLAEKQLNKRIAGVKFCYLVKGKREAETAMDGSKTGKYYTYNPFIRGYVKHGGENSVYPRIVPKNGGRVKRDSEDDRWSNYAFSWRFAHGANKSGFSQLSYHQGWRPFNVWEAAGGFSVKQWMQAIHAGLVQPNYGADVFGQHVYSPPEIFRNSQDIKLTLGELRSQTREISDRLRLVGGNPEEISDSYKMFPRSRSSCYWYFGEDCPYISICWKGYDPRSQSEAMGDMMDDAPPYRNRVPHHKLEAEQSKGAN